MDRRQRKTRAAIFSAFTTLLEKKNYSSLTIQDIIDEADIGRTTLQENQQSIKGILSGECGEVFMRYFKEYLYRIFEGQLTSESDIPKDYRLHQAVSSYAETVSWWLKGKSEYSPEQVMDFYFKSVNI